MQTASLGLRQSCRQGRGHRTYNALRPCESEVAQSKARGDCPHQLPQPWGVPLPRPQQPPTVSGVFILHALEGGFFFFNSKPQLSQLLLNVALCHKGVLPKSCCPDNLDLCPSAFQIITWVALPSKLDFSFLFLPAGDQQPTRICFVSLAPDSAVLYLRPPCPFRLPAHTQLRDNTHSIGCSDPRGGVREAS